ncbi:hypothetical protein OF83DRAFT_619137 [Amylostereum chailletii]|nr:hypothetical protein OF83DRAFT_619137 [Amylostereum chailletii]
MLNDADTEGGYTRKEHPRVQWARQELTDVAETLSKVHDGLSDTIHGLDEENAGLRHRIRDLENPADEILMLEVEIAAFKEQVGAISMERDELRRERDTSLRQLQAIRDMMTQILNETKDASTSFEPTGVSTREQYRFPVPSDSPLRSSQRATQRPLSRASSRGSLVPTEVFDTTPVRQPMPTPPTTEFSPSQFTNPPSSPSGQVPVLGAPFVDLREMRSKKPHLQGYAVPRPLHRVKSGEFGSPIRIPSSSSRQVSLNMSPGMSEGISVQYDDPQSDSSHRGKWRIRFATPPVAATNAAVPVNAANLIHRLGLDEEAVQSIEALAGPSIEHMRLHITGGLAFVHDPIVLETPNPVYLVDWGLTKMNRSIEAYIKTATASRPGLHTFIYSPKKTLWFYLGKYSWSTSPVKSVWPMLSEKAQRVLAARRAGGNSAAAASRMLEDGQLAQFAVQIDRLSDAEDEQVIIRKLRGNA